MGVGAQAYHRSWSLRKAIQRVEGIPRKKRLSSKPKLDEARAAKDNDAGGGERVWEKGQSRTRDRMKDANDCYVWGFNGWGQLGWEI